MADARIIARYSHGWTAYGTDWSISGSTGMRQILFQPSSKLNVRFTGITGSDFQVQGATADRNAALLDFGLNAKATPRLSVQFGYDGSFSGNAQGNALHGGLFYAF